MILHPRRHAITLQSVIRTSILQIINFSFKCSFPRWRSGFHEIRMHSYRAPLHQKSIGPHHIPSVPLRLPDANPRYRFSVKPALFGSVITDKPQFTVVVQEHRVRMSKPPLQHCKCAPARVWASAPNPSFPVYLDPTRLIAPCPARHTRRQ